MEPIKYSKFFTLCLQAPKHHNRLILMMQTTMPKVWFFAVDKLETFNERGQNLENKDFEEMGFSGSNWETGTGKVAAISLMYMFLHHGPWHKLKTANLTE